MRSFFLGGHTPGLEEQGNACAVVIGSVACQRVRFDEGKVVVYYSPVYEFGNAMLSVKVVIELSFYLYLPLCHPFLNKLLKAILHLCVL